MTVYKGACPCGAVEFEVDTGVAPISWSAVCHCLPCRKVNASSAVHVVGCPRESVKFTKGEEQLKTFDFYAGKWDKRYCGSCGTSISQGSKTAPYIGMFPANFEFAGRFPDMPKEFKPALHVNFENALMPEVFSSSCKLAKFKDFPKEFMGSDERME